MSNKNERELATRLVRYFREGRVTEAELLNKLSDFIFEPYWPEIAGMLSADELQRFRDDLRVVSLPQVFTVNFGGGPGISHEEKKRIRAWLDESAGTGTNVNRDTGMASRFVRYFGERRATEGELFLVLSEYVFDEDWAAISKLLSLDQTRDFRQLLETMCAPDSQEAIDSCAVLPSRAEKERIRRWLQEN